MKFRSYFASLNVSLLGTALVATSAVSIYALPSSRSPVPPALLTATPSPQEVGQAVYGQINQYRHQKGLPLLRWDAQISQQALAHSQALASGRVPLGHHGFQQRIQAIGKTTPYSRAAENVASTIANATPDRQAVQGWLSSPSHLKNITGPFDTTGIGVARNDQGQYYFTEIFIKRR